MLHSKKAQNNCAKYANQTYSKLLIFVTILRDSLRLIAFWHVIQSNTDLVSGFDSLSTTTYSEEPY